MDPIILKQAVEAGISPVCSTCTHFWAGRDKGLPFPQCTAPNPCGGPIAGLTFPEYIGPITNFEKFCFACTTPSDFGVKLPGKERIIGICKTHLRFLDTFEIQEQKVSLEILSDKGLVIPIRGRYTKKTLAEEIAELCPEK